MARRVAIRQAAAATRISIRVPVQSRESTSFAVVAYSNRHSPSAQLMFLVTPIFLPILLAIYIARLLFDMTGSRLRIKKLEKKSRSAADRLVHVLNKAERGGDDDAEVADPLVTRDYSPAHSRTSTMYTPPASSNTFYGAQASPPAGHTPQASASTPDSSPALSRTSTMYTPPAITNTFYGAQAGYTPQASTSTLYPPQASTSTSSLYAPQPSSSSLYVPEASAGLLYMSGASTSSLYLPDYPELPKEGLVMSDAQKQMVAWLNALPRLRKELVWIHPSRNSHGSIIAREIKRDSSHRIGRGVIRHWTDHFVM